MGAFTLDLLHPAPHPHNIKNSSDQATAAHLHPFLVNPLSWDDVPAEKLRELGQKVSRRIGLAYFFHAKGLGQKEVSYSSEKQSQRVRKNTSNNSQRHVRCEDDDNNDDGEQEDDDEKADAEKEEKEDLGRQHFDRKGGAGQRSRRTEKTCSTAALLGMVPVLDLAPSLPQKSAFASALTDAAVWREVYGGS